MKPPQLVYTDNPGSIPASFRVGDGMDVELESISATFNGAAASGTFLACVAVYSQDGKLIGRFFPSQTFVTGDSGEVTYGPFLGESAGSSGGVPIIGRTTFEPAAGFVQITSTDQNNPTTIVTSSAIDFDGLTTIRIEFCAAGVDMDQRGIAAVGGPLFELYDNGTAVGIIADYNAASGDYMIQQCYMSAFDTPTAGTHTYSIRAWRQGPGGLGASYVYGSNLTTAHATRAGFLLVTAYDLN